MSTLGSIVIDLLLKTGAFVSDAKVAEKRLEELTKQAKAAGVVLGTVLAAGATAATAAIKSSIDQMDEMSKSAQKVGMTTEAFSALTYAGDLADVSMGDLQSSMGRLIKAQAAALDAGSEQAKVFDALGISVTDASGGMRKAEDVFADFADAFQRQKGSPEIMAAGFSIFGKSFQTLIPLLKDGSSGLREAADEAAAFGHVIGTDAGEQAEAFNDNLTRLGSLVSGLANAVAADLLPELVHLTDGLVDSAKEGDALAETASGVADVFRAVGVAIEFAKGPLGAIDDLIQGVTIAMVGLVESAKGVINLDWDQIKRGLEVQHNGASLALLGSDQVGKDGRGKPAASKPTVTLIDPTETLKEDARVVAQMREARAEAERLRKLAFEGDEKQTKSPRTKKLKEEKDAVTVLMESYEALYGDANEKSESYIANVEREIALYGQTSEAAKAAYDIKAGAFGALSQQQADYILSLAKTKDALDDYDAIYGESTKKAKGKLEGLSAVADQAARNMQDSFADFLFDPFSNGVDGMAKSFSDTLRKLAAEAAASKIFDAVGKWATSYTGTGAGWVNAIGGILGATTKKAGGGSINGPGTGTSDSIPAWLSDGEYVIKADAVTHYGKSFFDGLNAKRLASGGYVGTSPAVPSGGPSVAIQIENKGQPVQATATASKQPDGSTLIKMVLSEVASDMARGGSIAAATKSRFDVKERA